MSKKEQIRNIFKQKGDIVKLEQITNQGINKYHLQKLVDSGEVEKIHHGIYKLAEYC